MNSGGNTGVKHLNCPQRRAKRRGYSITRQWSNHSEPARAMASMLQSIPSHGRGPQRQKPKAKVEARTPVGTYLSRTLFTAPFDGRAINDLFTAQQRNVEAWRELSNLWVKTLEAITTRQVAAAKALTDQFTNGSGKLFGSRAPDERGAAQAELLRNWIDTWFVHLCRRRPSPKRAAAAASTQGMSFASGARKPHQNVKPWQRLPACPVSSRGGTDHASRVFPSAYDPGRDA